MGCRRHRRGGVRWPERIGRLASRSMYPFIRLWGRCECAEAPQLGDVCARETVRMLRVDLGGQVRMLSGGRWPAAIRIARGDAKAGCFARPAYRSSGRLCRVAPRSPEGTASLRTSIASRPSRHSSMLRAQVPLCGGRKHSAFHCVHMTGPRPGCAGRNKPARCAAVPVAQGKRACRPCPCVDTAMLTSAMS